MAYYLRGSVKEFMVITIKDNKPYMLNTELKFVPLTNQAAVFTLTPHFRMVSPTSKDITFDGKQLIFGQGNYIKFVSKKNINGYYSGIFYTLEFNGLPITLEDNITEVHLLPNSYFVSPTCNLLKDINSITANEINYFNNTQVSNGFTNLQECQNGYLYDYCDPEEKCGMCFGRCDRLEKCIETQKGSYVPFMCTRPPEKSWSLVTYTLIISIVIIFLIAFFLY